MRIILAFIGVGALLFVLRLIYLWMRDYGWGE